MIPTVIRNAFKHAEAERPGAVHIELPEDVAEKETDAAVQKRGEIRVPYPNLEAVRKGAAMICEAKNPLIMVSSGANRKGSLKSLGTSSQKQASIWYIPRWGKVLSLMIAFTVSLQPESIPEIILTVEPMDLI